MISSRWDRERSEGFVACRFSGSVSRWEEWRWRWRLRIRSIRAIARCPHMWVGRGEKCARWVSVVVGIDLRYLEVVHVYHQAEYFCRALSEYEKHKRKIERRPDHLSCACAFSICIFENCTPPASRTEGSSITKRSEACCACVSSALSRYRRRHVTALVCRFGRSARFLKLHSRLFRDFAVFPRMFRDPCQPVSTNTSNFTSAVYTTLYCIHRSLSF